MTLQPTTDYVLLNPSILDEFGHFIFEESVKFYDLAGKHENVIALLNKLLSQVVVVV